MTHFLEKQTPKLDGEALFLYYNNMRKINEDIKTGEYKKVYLLYGSEDYLKKQYKQKLRAAICGDDTMNYSYFEGKECDATEIKGISETLPFFADRRLVLIENSGFFKSANETINEYISSVPDTTCIVFVESEVDKRSKLFKTIKDMGYVCEMAEQNQAALEQWIVGILGQNGMKITKATVEKFLTAVGTDMENISKELEKVISYAWGREVVTDADIDAVCSVQISSRIFDMIDAMSNKNRAKALELYNDMMALKEPPMRILFMLARQFNIMLQVKELLDRNVSSSDIASKVGIQPFIVGKITRQLSGKNGFTGKLLKEALEDCVNIEWDIKNGRMDDKAGVEMILIKYS